MSAGVGGVTHKHYADTAGLKVAGNQLVKKSTLLTRNGNNWLAGLNVAGKGGALYALCDGLVYFTKKKGSYKRTKIYTYIHIKPKAINN